MKTNNVPALIMLSAGALYCLIGIRNGIELTQFMTQLLIVLIIFFIIGSILRAVLDKAMDVMATKKVEEETTDSENGTEGIVENIEAEKLHQS